MPVTLYTFVGLYDRALDSLSHLLDKGEAFAASRASAADDMLDWRLVEDMHPMRFQAKVVVNFARSWTARVAGLPVPEDIDDSLDLAGFRAAIGEAKRFLASIDAAALNARDDVPLTIKITDTMEPTLPGGQWMSVFAATNINFHLSMVYAILRMKGVPIGKIDLFAGRI